MPVRVCPRGIKQYLIVYEKTPTFKGDILKITRSCDVLKIMRSCDILKIMRSCDILKIMRSCDVLKII